MKKTIKALYDQLIVANAGEVHIQFRGVENDNQAIAVVSVYHGQRPAHDVLDDLYLWAEERGDDVLLAKIDELSALADDSN